MTSVVGIDSLVNVSITLVADLILSLVKK